MAILKVARLGHPVLRQLSAPVPRGQILISSRVLYKVESLITCEPMGAMSLKGFARPVPAFNVLGLKAG